MPGPYANSHRSKRGFAKINKKQKKKCCLVQDSNLGLLSPFCGGGIFSQGVKIHPDVLWCTFFVQPQGIEPEVFSCSFGRVTTTPTWLLIVGRVVSYFDLYG